MKTNILLAFCFLLILPLNYVFCAQDDWVLEFDENGTRVYTQLSDSDYKQVKIITTIDAPLEIIMGILTKFPEYKDWMHQVNDCYLINRSDSVYYVYMHEDPSWPIQDRYQVSRIKVKHTYRRARIEFESVPDYIEKKVDAIQIRQYDGYWDIQARNERQCQLEYVLIQQPGGHVPPWLSNIQAHEKPYRSILNLKRIAEARVFRP